MSARSLSFTRKGPCDRSILTDVWCQCGEMGGTNHGPSQDRGTNVGEFSIVGGREDERKRRSTVIDGGRGCVLDPRSGHGRCRPIGAVLALDVRAMLCGARRLPAVSQWGRNQGGDTAEALGITWVALSPGTPLPHSLIIIHEMPLTGTPQLLKNARGVRQDINSDDVSVEARRCTFAQFAAGSLP